MKFWRENVVLDWMVELNIDRIFIELVTAILQL